VSFLAPLFLAGAAAVALPLLFHLIRRSAKEKVVFSSLMFLDPSPPRITKRSRLEHLLLLLLRCAVVALLAFAFARPFLPKAAPAAPAAAESERVAVLVDLSASMRREDLWEQARAKAVEAVRGLGPGDALAVYAFDQQLRAVLAFAESAGMPAGERAAAAQNRLAALSPGWQATHLGHAMIRAAEELVEELNRDSVEQGTAGLRLIVISDFQAGAKLDGLQGFEWPKRFAVRTELVSARENSNAGLQALAEPPRIFSAASNAPVRVRVQNSPGSAAEQFTLQWRRGAEPVGEKLGVYVPAGENRIAAAPAQPPEASALALDGDKASFDNLAHVVRAAQPEVLVAYFGGEAPGDPQGLRYYLHRAFEQTNLATRVLAFSNAVPAEARQAGLLIVGAAPNEDCLALARSLLDAGRAVLFPIADAGQAGALSALLGGVLAGVEEAPVKNFALLSRMDFQHPLFAPFADARFSDFAKIHFWRHRKLNLTNAPSASVLAAFDSGDPALAEIPVGQGRLWVLAATWRPADSQLAVSSKFVPLLFGMLEQSSQQRAVARQYAVGDTVELPAGSPGIVVLPDGKERPAANGKFSETSAPGVYRAGDFLFAVNLDPAESRVAPMAADELLNLGVPVDAAAGSAPETAASTVRSVERERHMLATDAESRQKFWRQFLVAAIAFLFIETWLAGRLSRVPSAA